MSGLEETEFKILGIQKVDEMNQRVPTLSLVHPRQSPERAAKYLAEQGIFTWSGNHYAVPFTESMGIEPEGTLRVGLLHYNTQEEVERLLVALKEMDKA